MIDLTIHRQALDRNIQKARESGVVIPTFENKIGRASCRERV